MVTLCNSCEFQDTCEIFEIMGDSMPITHCKNYIQTRRETVRAKQTNGDRIRSMTDEELARFIANKQAQGYNDADHSDEFAIILLEWLRKDVDDGDK